MAGTVKKATSEGVTRYTAFAEDGSRIDTFERQSDALVAIGLCPQVKDSKYYTLYPSYCRKPIKTEGATLCNFHLSVIRRQNEREDERRQEYSRRQQVSSMASSRKAELLAAIRATGLEVNDLDVAPEMRSDPREGYRVSPSTFTISYSVLKTLVEMASKS
jgi:hypothetical protein